jgi:hypothetical protein
MKHNTINYYIEEYLSGYKNSDHGFLIVAKVILKLSQIRN